MKNDQTHSAGEYAMPQRPRPLRLLAARWIHMHTKTQEHAIPTSTPTADMRVIATAPTL
jgi:hypothetical protein